MIKEFVKRVKIWFLLRKFQDGCTCPWIVEEGFDILQYRKFLSERFGFDGFEYGSSSLGMLLIRHKIRLSHTQMFQLRKELLREFLSRVL